MKIKITLMTALLITIVSLSGSQGASDDMSLDDAIKHLSKINTNKVSYLSHEDRLAINACFKTKRLDCAVLLIKALSISRNPHTVDRLFDDFHMLPSLPLIKINYNENICPLIMYEALNSGNYHFQRRCVFALREMCSNDKINEIRETFLIDKSPAENAIVIKKLLDEEEIVLDEVRIKVPIKLPKYPSPFEEDNEDKKDF